jgi:serine palmitoyltransferase
VNGLEVKVRGVAKPVLNVSSFDFLGLGLQPSMKEVSLAALEKYGCGSCGPRGFYGSVDQHLFVEQAVASFMGTQEAILYSDGSTAVSSTIPAFSKKGDLLIVDEACSEPILTGCNLSRSTVHFFKHNDMADLASILRSIAKEDKRLRVDTTQQRRFIVVEGVYRNTGSICNLPELLRLGKEFFYRLIVDESISFGTMGRTGRGLTEHYGISIYDIDIITFSLDTTLASIGGICIGTREIVDHQRLSGAGYCFSASAPPFLSAAAIESLHLMETNPQYLVSLRENTAKCIASLKNLESLGLRLVQDPQAYPSPIIHLALHPTPVSKELENEMIVHLYSQCLQHGVGVSINRSAMLMKRAPWSNSIRLCGSAAWTDSDIKRINQGIAAALKATMKEYAK